MAFAETSKMQCFPGIGIEMSRSWNFPVFPIQERKTSDTTSLKFLSLPWAATSFTDCTLVPYLGGIVIIRWHKLVEDQFQTVWNLQLSVPPVCVYINELAKILTNCRCIGQLRWKGESVCPPAFAPSRWQSGSPAHQPTKEQNWFFWKSKVRFSPHSRGEV